MWIRFSRAALYFFLLAFVVVISLIANYSHVDHIGKKYSQSNIDYAPYNKVGLLLWTSKYVSKGQENLFYTYRIEGAAELYENKKIDFLIVSGDNETIHYNEPETMKDDLVEAGIPEEKIYLDHAGFRTLDSVMRAKEIFWQEKMTIISQSFHNYRAIYIARKQWIQAVWYNVKDVPVAIGPKVYIREFLARVKMQADLLMGKWPKFLGEEIEIK